MHDNVQAVVTSDGLMINGHRLYGQVMLNRYEEAFGRPTRSFPAGPPAPVGHRNNQVHVFDTKGIYLTEHHASRLIQSVNFVLDPTESLFPIQAGFDGTSGRARHTFSELAAPRRMSSRKSKSQPAWRRLHLIASFWGSRLTSV